MNIYYSDQEMIVKKKILVYGLWNFWYAFLQYLDNNIDHNLYELCGFDRKNELIQNLRITWKHIYLHTDQCIDISNITFFDDAISAIKDTHLLILCVTSSAIWEVISSIWPYIQENIYILNTAKALSDNWDTYSQHISKSKYGSNIKYWMIAGWTIASDLFLGYPLWATLAFDDMQDTVYISSIIESKSLDIEKSDDVLWVEYAWAFKNIWSILAWYLYGKWYPYGTETLFLTRFLREVHIFCTQYLWCDSDTFTIWSYCRWNDFWMSCTWETRNRKYWNLLGSGMTYADAFLYIQKNSITVEWIYTLKFLWIILERVQDEFPILNALCKIDSDEDFLDWIL